MQQVRPQGRTSFSRALQDTTFSAYPYVCFVDSLGVSDIDDAAFLDRAGRVVFPVNKYRLNPREPLLRQLDSIVLPRINRDSLQLVRMVIRGAASPEGPYLNNKMLSERRAAALADFVNQRLQFPVEDGRFSLDVEIEDYRTLLLLMQRAGDPDYDLVRPICDRYLPKGDMAGLKRALRTKNRGWLWRRLLRNYFPDLRTARILLYFKKVRPRIVIPGLTDVEQLPTEQQEVQMREMVILVPEEPIVLPRREVLSVKTNLLFDMAYVPGYDRWCPIPNVAVEYYPRSGHFTFGASFDFPWWQNYEKHKFFQIRNYQLETRYYLKDSRGNGNTGAYRARKAYYRRTRTSEPESGYSYYEPYDPDDLGRASEATGGFRGFYLQAYAHVALFGLCFDEDRGWVGEGAGLGIGAGYVLPLSRNGHWRLELGVQAGFFRCKYDPYQYENPVDPTYRDGLYYYKWTGDPSLFRKRQYRWNWLGPMRVGVTLSYDLLYRRVQKRGVGLKSYELLERRPAL
ncbi:MAG: DUF3575 domain-containing protein [Prevotella sp.]|nr:DUF3575 domain-containing protein [Prevotella sp.]